MGSPFGLHEDAVLVVAEVGRAQPHGAVLLEHHPAVAEVVERGVDRARLGQALLAEPRVERDADAGRGSPAGRAWPARSPTQRVGVVGHLRRPLADVLARVAVLGQAPSPAFARRQRRAEELHLHAAVVEVVLAVDDVAGALEDPAQRVAEGRPPPAARVERPGGVGRHELDVDPPCRRRGRGARSPSSPPASTSASTSWSHVSRRWKFTKPGPGDLDPLDVGRRRGVRAARRGRRPARAARDRPALAVAMATLEDQSPCSRRPGRSRWISAGGSMPASVEGGAQGGGEGVADHGRRMLRGALFCSPDRSGGREGNPFVSEGPRGGSVGSC